MLIRKNKWQEIRKQIDQKSSNKNTYLIIIINLSTILIIDIN